MADVFAQVVATHFPTYKLKKSEKLLGGVSAEVSKLTLLNKDEQEKVVVLRKYGDLDIKLKPRVANHEFLLLQILQNHGISVPTPLVCDESCTLLPKPYIIVSFAHGAVLNNGNMTSDQCTSLAHKLLQIHTVPPKQVPFLEKFQLKKTPEVLDLEMSEDLIRSVLKKTPEPEYKPVLLHGDFWPGNMLWEKNKISSILDWEDALVGPALFDVANCRLELLWFSGREAMETFTNAYFENKNWSKENLAYWDLVAALKPCGSLKNWGLDSKIQTEMLQKHRMFVEEAIEVVGQYQ